MLLNGQPTAAELLADASAQKYTINGEMFSAQYLYELVQKHVSNPLTCHFHEGFLDCDQIKQQLCSGACLLVPYPFQKIFSLAIGSVCLWAALVARVVLLRIY